MDFEIITYHTAIMIGVITVAVFVVILLRKALKVILYIFIALILCTILCITFDLVDKDKATEMRDKLHNSISQEITKRYAKANDISEM